MSRTRGALVFLLAGALAVLVAVALGRAGAESSRIAGASFRVPVDPEAAVVHMRIAGGMLLGAGVVDYTLRGDGSLVYEESHGRQRRERFELSPLEVDDLVRGAVEGGLIGLEWKSLEARLKPLGRAGTQLTDMPDLTIEISLDQYRDAAGVERGPVVSRFYCSCSPTYLAHFFSDVEEVAALDSLVRALQKPFHPVDSTSSC